MIPLTHVAILCITLLSFWGCSSTGNCNENEQLLTNERIVYGGAVHYDTKMEANATAYVRLEPEIGDARVVALKSGVFEAELFRPKNSGSVEIILFMDQNGNQKRDLLTEPMVFLGTFDNQNAPKNLNLTLRKVSGKIDSSQAMKLGRFDFNASKNPPLLRLDEVALFEGIYYLLEKDGSFEFYVLDGQTIDLRLTHTRADIPNIFEDYNDRRYQQLGVQLLYEYTVTSDTIVNDQGKPVSLIPHNVEISNTLDYPDVPLYFLAGEIEEPYVLLTDDNREANSSMHEGNYTVYFRNYDALQARDGILSPLAINMQSDFVKQAFIDLDGNGFIGKEDPKSRRYFYDQQDQTLLIPGFLESNVSISGNISLHRPLDENETLFIILQTETGDDKLVELNGTAFDTTFRSTRDDKNISMMLFFDANGNKKADFLEELVVPIGIFSTENSEDNISIELVTLEGKIDNTEPMKLNRFDFTSSENPPLIRLDNGVVFDNIFQSVNRDGSFKVVVPRGMTTTLTLLHVEGVKDYKSEYHQLDHHYLGLHLLYEHEVNASIVLTEGNSSDPIKLVSHILQVDNRHSFPNLPLHVKAGEQEFPLKLLTDLNRDSNASIHEGNYTIYFRNYDSQYVTDGLVPKTPENPDSDFSKQVFIDVNQNWILESKDYASHIYRQDDLDMPMIIFDNTLPPEPPKDWILVATVAGASVDRGNEDNDIEKILDHMVDANVSVVEFDSSLSQYLTEAEFEQELELMRRSATMAKARNLKSVWYYPAMEVITSGGEFKQSSMYKDNPDWVQIDANGNPNIFYGSKVFWVEPGDESAWMEPLSPWREFFIERVKKIAKTGIDGVWLDVPLFNDIVGIWPSHHPLQKEKFFNETGMQIPQIVEDDFLDMTNINTRRGFSWRYHEIDSFLKEILVEARKVNPEFYVVVETVTMDYNSGFRQGLDGAMQADFEGMMHVWEVDVLSDSVAMRYGYEDDFISLIAMYKYGRGSDLRHGSWAFTYGIEPDDAEVVMAICSAAQVSSYEIKSPEMTTTVSQKYRKKMFSFIRKYEDLMLRSESQAEVLLLHSTASRDFTDGFCVMSGSCGVSLFATWQRPDPNFLWWANHPVEGLYASDYMAEYRGTVKMLVDAHIPFDLMSTRSITTERLKKYKQVVIPTYKAISKAEMDVLTAYVANGGHVLLTGEKPGVYDDLGFVRTLFEFDLVSDLRLDSFNGVSYGACRYASTNAGSFGWCNREFGKEYMINKLSDNLARFEALLNGSERSLLQTDAPSGVYLELYEHENQSLLHVVNYKGVKGSFVIEPATFEIHINLNGKKVKALYRDTPHLEVREAISFKESSGVLTFDIEDARTWTTYIIEYEI